jgi:hypothetical protein
MPGFVPKLHERRACNSVIVSRMDTTSLSMNFETLGKPENNHLHFHSAGLSLVCQPKIIPSRPRPGPTAQVNCSRLTCGPGPAQCALRLLHLVPLCPQVVGPFVPVGCLPSAPFLPYQPLRSRPCLPCLRTESQVDFQKELAGLQVIGTVGRSQIHSMRLKLALAITL